MGIIVYSLLWVMQDFVHQPNYWVLWTLRVSWRSRHTLLRAGLYLSRGGRVPYYRGLILTKTILGDPFNES